MELAQPDRLILLALLPVLFLLSLPPRPKRTVITAHLAQWLAAQRRLRRRPVRFRWLRFLLLAAAFLALVVAHTGPRLPGREGPRELVVLLDASASMAARQPDGATAYDRARAIAGEVLARAPEHVDVRVGLCGAEIEVLRGTRQELRAALALRQPAGGGQVDLGQAAQALAGPGTAVLTITDALGPTAAPAAGALRRVGGAAANAAITACTVEDSWPLPEIAVRVEVASSAPRDLRVHCQGGVAAAVERRVHLAADAVETVRFALRRGTGGRLWVRIDGAADPLPADDAVAIDLPAPPQPQIVVRAPGVPTRALRTAAEALAAECGGRVVLAADAARAGFLLMEAGELAAPPGGEVRMMSFGTGLGAGTAGRTVASPRVLDWDRSHPVTAGLDLSDLQVGQALAWPAAGFPGPADLVLIRGKDGPLAVLHRAGDAASVHFAFRLEDSNLFKLAAFPQLIRRSFAVAYGAAARAVIAPGAVLDPAESRLQPAASPPPADRPLPAFADPSRGLAVPFLLLALLLLAIRVYV